MCAATWCKIQITLFCNFRSAREVSSEIFERANIESTSCNESALFILQNLRDKYVSLPTTCEDKNLEVPNLACTEVNGMSALEQRMIMSASAPELAQIRSSSRKLLRSSSASRIKGFNTSDEAFQINPIVRDIKFALSVGQGSRIQLEDINGSEDIIPSLQYVFRIYIRGNSLPGQMFGAQDVVLGDNKLSMDRFLLQVRFCNEIGI